MLPDDQLRFILSLFFTIPLGLILKYMPNNLVVKKYYSIISATLLQYYVYGNELFWALALHFIIYFIIKTKGRQSGFLVTLVSMAALSAYHIYRLITNYGSTGIELSFILMLYVAKYSLFAFSYQDGGLSEQKLKHQYQKTDRIVQLPSLFDFIGYLQFVPTCVLNTPVDYNKYNSYMKKQGIFANVPLMASFKKAGKDLTIGLICAGFYFMQVLYFPLEHIKEPGFTEYSVAYICYYTCVSVWFLKFKYYVAWKLSMMSVHASGISYDPSNKTDPFLGVQVCNPWEIETTFHIRQKVNNWNMTVQQWLRKCVYDRLPVSKSQAQLVTFAISSFWHGMYGGYYLSFFFWFLQLYASGLIFKFSENARHPIVKLYKKYNPFSFWLAWFVWNWLFAYNGLYFQLLSANIGYRVLESLYFAPGIFTVIIIVALTLMPKQKKNSNNEKIKQSAKNK